MASTIVTVALLLLLGVGARSASQLFCGDTSLRKIHVINGAEVEPKHSWPWVVSLRARSDREHFCGGVLLNDDIVLTAAHCLHNVGRNGRVLKQARDILVTTGDHDLSIRDSGEQLRFVKALYPHTDWSLDPQDFSNDVAIVHLKPTKGPIRRATTKPICLPDSDHDKPAAKEHCAIAGWGQTEDAAFSNVLRNVIIPIVPKSACKKLWRGYLDDSMICAGVVSYNTPEGPCNGDSGGPLMCEGGNGALYIDGIVSWGSVLCMRKPGVFTDVTHVSGWVREKVRSLGETLPPPKGLPLITTEPPPPTPPCTFSDFQLTPRLDINVGGQDVRRRLSGIQCTLECCRRRSCQSVQYYPAEKRCQLQTLRQCDVSKSKWSYPSKQRVFYIGRKC